MNSAGADEDVTKFVNDALQPFYPNEGNINASPFYDGSSVDRPDLSQRMRVPVHHYGQQRWMNGDGADINVAKFVNDGLAPFYPEEGNINASPFYEGGSTDRPAFHQRRSVHHHPSSRMVNPHRKNSYAQWMNTA